MLVISIIAATLLLIILAAGFLATTVVLGKFKLSEAAAILLALLVCLGMIEFLILGAFFVARLIST